MLVRIDEVIITVQRWCRYVLVIISAVWVAGCYQTRYDFNRSTELHTRERDQVKQREFPIQSGADLGLQLQEKRLPWETWIRGRDLYGQPLTNAALLRGDELSEAGQREAARVEYVQVFANPNVSIAERDAALLRLAGTELALDRAQSALDTLSATFVKRKLTINDVEPRFGLVFAYAYGRLNNIRQSLAWFSQVYRDAGGKGGFAQSAESGARLLLGSMDEPELRSLVDVWISDAFISSIIGQELRRREQGSFTAIPQAGGEQFWKLPSTEGVPASGILGEQTVGVLLPLSGRYAALGAMVKNGIALAFIGHEAKVRLVYRDTQGEPAIALAAFEELLNTEKVDAVVGPLLAEPARVVAERAGRREVPLLVLAKSAVAAPDAVFQLGPTIESQASSLVKAATTKLNIRRIAVISPADRTGDAFARQFVEELRLRQLQPVYQQRYVSSEAPAFEGISELLEREQVDAVFLPDDLAVANSFMLNLSESQRKRIRLLGPAKWYNVGELQRSNKLLEGIIFVCPYFYESGLPYSVRFNESFQARFGKKPDFLAAQGFDAATLILAALQRQAVQGGGVAQALRSIDYYDGLTGLIRVTSLGTVERNFVVVKLEPGRLVLLPETKVVTTPDSFTMRGNEQIQ